MRTHEKYADTYAETHWTLAGLWPGRDFVGSLFKTSHFVTAHFERPLDARNIQKVWLPCLTL